MDHHWYLTCLLLHLLVTTCSSTCPKIIEGRSPSNGSCYESCESDSDCAPDHKCCTTSCGGHICTTGGLDVRRNECEVIVCGANAECSVDTADSPALCKCRPGFSGNPNDLLQGCKKSSKLKLMCDYKNKSYGIEESFFDGCDKKCICTEALEVDCSPRCPHSAMPELTPPDPLCSLIEDPKDPCCKVIACESRSVFQTTPLIDSFNGSSSALVIDVNVNLPPKDCKASDGTVHKPGDVFLQGCESKCTCRETGEILCNPRCSLIQGFDANKCQLVPDPSDSECCKIALCDLKPPGNSSLVLELLEPLNSTTVRIKVVIEASALVYKQANSSVSLVNPQLELIMSEVHDEMHEESGEAIEKKLHWSTVAVDEASMRQLAPGSFEFDVSALKPATEYLMKLMMPMMKSAGRLTSNTVSVKTFPPGIDSSFTGCFHGNKTYDTGQVFFDGCAYKCTCREGGLRECEERCPVYLDTVGYENCVWQPAPDDPCCTIPVCDKMKMPPPAKVIPSPSPVPMEPFCTVMDQVYSVGQSWEETNGCIKKICKCSLLENETTSVECLGGCAEIPETALRPTLDCPKPSLVTPRDPCLCPYVVCHQSRNPILPPPRLPNSRQRQTVARQEVSCELNGRRLAIGEEVYDGCRAVCHCGSDGELNCALIECPHHFGDNFSECMEWEAGPELEPSPPNCCPRRKCKVQSGFSCMFGELKIENSMEVPSQLLPCGIRCVCMSGKIKCENRCPILPDIPPPTLPCPSHLAVRAHLPGDECCYHWICSNERTGRIPPLRISNSSPNRKEVARKEIGCVLNGRRLAVGEEVYVGCRATCHCRSDADLNCEPLVCPQHDLLSECVNWGNEPELEPSPPNCCPRRKCKKHLSCTFGGLEIDHSQRIPSQLLPCGIQCLCVSGKITCENICPVLSPIPPPSLPCPSHVAVRGQIPGRECCLQWVCPKERKNECQHVQNEPRSPSGTLVLFPPLVLLVLISYLNTVTNYYNYFI